MPPFNPMLIGAPSPVGRGGATGAVSPLGSVLYAETQQDKTLPADGRYIATPNEWPYPSIANPNLLNVNNISWQSIGNPSGGNTNCQGPIYFNGQFYIFVYGNFGGGTPLVCYVGDGLSASWTQRTVVPGSVTAAAAYGRPVIFKGRMYVATTIGVYGSDDGINWSQFTTRYTTRIHSFPDALVCLGSARQSNQDTYSLDGVNFIAPGASWPMNSGFVYTFTKSPTTGLWYIGIVDSDGDGNSYNYGFTSTSPSGPWTSVAYDGSFYAIMLWFLDAFWGFNSTGGTVRVGPNPLSGMGPYNTDGGVCPPGEPTANMLIAASQASGRIYYVIDSKQDNNNMLFVQPASLTGQTFVGTAIGNGLVLHLTQVGIVRSLPLPIDKTYLPALQSRIGKNGKRLYPFVKVA